ncbi:hypothetical protein [Virgisporangium ochraceum]|uniref:TROVE domain-containing protein n=1 Tax=Virgisporangium ochraceum TaxID=65505 RepID=A0A8J3ZYW8_9ACTN|nr:hypothetical protein [Virgisporangium ochraceum]GIJ70778.1 hypothetical protein Voc01_056950 [Virgisporangium ochraceum]
MSLRDLVACEDVVMFVNAAIASTGQREFHSDAATQRLSLDFLHEYVRTNYRPVYAACLALDINDHNAGRIVAHLLRTSQVAGPAERATEGRLIAARLRRMPPQRVYRVFAQLRTWKVNNRRTRAIVRDWLAGRNDLTFDAVKYRRGLAGAARHAHLALPTEVGAALFDWRRRKRYDAPLLETWRRAHYDRSALYDLPYTVAEGLAARHGIDRKTFLDRIAPRLTARERLRLQESAARLGVTAVRDEVPHGSLTRLASYALALPRRDRAARREELTAALRDAARRVAGRRAGTWGRVVAVLDDSYSSAGSGTKRRRPLAVALAAHYLLDELAASFTGLWLAHRGDPLLVHPFGATPLGERILDALELRPDRLVVVSDGWDNAPVGLAGEVLRVWRTRIDPDRRTDVVHLNPVYEAHRFDVRPLAGGVASVGIRDAEDLPALVELARFGTGTAAFDELLGYLDERVSTFLSGEAP